MESGDKIFILGNGPSLKGFDFEKLRQVPTIGLNVAYRYWEKIKWYPTYYCCLDTEVIKSHKDAIKELLTSGKVKKLCVRQTFIDLFPELKNHKDILVYESLCQTSPYFMSTDQSKITTGSHSIRFGMSLGYKKIYLLGIDCRYTEVIREARKLDQRNKLIIVKAPKRNPNYFFDDYQQKGDTYHVPNPNIQTENLHVKVFEILRTDIKRYKFDCKVINCNQRSVLYNRKIFPYKELDAVLESNKLHAVTINTIDTNEEKLITFFKNLSKRAPFLNPENIIRTDLFCLIKANFNLGLRKKIRVIYHESANLKQFNLKFVVIKDLSYRSSFNNVINYMLTNMDDYTYSLYLEPSAYSVQDDWLRTLIENTKKGKNIWIQSAIQNKLNQTMTETGVYATGSKKFRNFYLKIFLPWYQTLNDTTIPFNIALNLFFSEARKNRIRWIYIGGYYPRFKVVNFIEKGRGVFDEKNTRRLKKKKPNLLIVTS